MSSLIPTVRGSVKIEVLKDGKVIKTQETPNTLVLEAPKILLGNIIGPNLTEGVVADFPKSDNTRPTISAGGPDGPRTQLSVNYLSLGYNTTGQTESITVSANDTMPLQGSSKVTKLLTGVTLGEYNVQFVCSFDVTNETANRSYFEAALLCPSLTQGTLFVVPDPENDPFGDYVESEQVMFAHQTHTPLVASAGSTIRYTWTISMQEPSDA